MSSADTRLCRCHGVPMVRNGPWWTCRVKMRQRRNRQRSRDPERWRAMDARRHRRARTLNLRITGVREITDDGGVKLDGTA